MPNIVIVGAQWGDEGKAKVVDFLTERSDVIIRYQGGANAGHTVIANGSKFVFHLVPSGIIYPSKICVVGNGVVFDAEQFITEIDELQEKGISAGSRLFVSDLAHLVLPYHKEQDRACESARDGAKIGTTGRGIGPAYADKALRTGIRVGDLVDWNNFTRKLTENYTAKKALIENVYHGTIEVPLNALIERYKAVRERIMPYIADTSRLIFLANQQGKSLLFEGAQGTFLDIDHGTYPFVTSSNTIAGCACTGCGIGPSMIGYVVGIIKTYTTRVGNGPFPTELSDPIGEEMRRMGGEFGATTGRPRRCGWFDSVMVRKAIELNGITHMALTKLDVLGTFDEIKLCTHYEINGKRLEQYPSDPKALEQAVPVYETFEGWKSDISTCKSYSQLPQKAVKYLNRLQALCHNTPILIVSVGPDRLQTIEVSPI